MRTGLGWFGLVWFGLVFLWHINHCRLFNVKSVFIHINSSIQLFHFIQWTVQFQTIQFSISTQFSSIWLKDRTLSGATTPGQSGLGGNGNKGVFHVPQSSCIIGTTPSDCIMSYPEQSLGEFYPSTEKQSVYSTATTDWARGMRR